MVIMGDGRNNLFIQHSIWLYIFISITIIISISRTVCAWVCKRLSWTFFGKFRMKRIAKQKCTETKLSQSADESLFILYILLYIEWAESLFYWNAYGSFIQRFWRFMLTKWQRYEISLEFWKLKRTESNELTWVGDEYEYYVNNFIQKQKLHFTLFVWILNTPESRIFLWCQRSGYLYRREWGELERNADNNNNNKWISIYRRWSLTKPLVKYLSKSFGSTLVNRVERRVKNMMSVVHRQSRPMLFSFAVTHRIVLQWWR